MCQCSSVNAYAMVVWTLRPTRQCWRVVYFLSITQTPATRHPNEASTRVIRQGPKRQGSNAELVSVSVVPYLAACPSPSS